MQYQRQPQQSMQQTRQVKTYYMIYNRNDNIGTIKSFLTQKFTSNNFGLSIRKEDSSIDLGDDEKVPENEIIVIDPTWCSNNEPSDIVDIRLMYIIYFYYYFIIVLVYLIILIYMK